MAEIAIGIVAFILAYIALITALPGPLGAVAALFLSILVGASVWWVIL